MREYEFDDDEDDEDITQSDFGNWLAVFWDEIQQGKLKIGLFTSQSTLGVPPVFAEFIETLDIPA